MNYKFVLVFGAAFLIFLSGCTSPEDLNVPEETTALDNAKIACTELCDDAISQGMDLSNGPCLGNPIEGASTYVCDIAHSPRADVDNLPENQCSAYREGIATHFVELDEQCNLIKVH